MNTENATVTATPVIAPMKASAVLDILNKSVNPEVVAEFTSGMKFKLRYVPRALFTKFANDSMEQAYDEKTRERVSKLNADKFAERFLTYAVLGWEGITLRSIQSIIPLDTTGKTDDELDAPVEFSIPVLRKMFDQAYALDQFINTTVVDLASFRPNLAKETKN